MGTTAPRGGEASDACAHDGDMSSRASQWPCPQPPTTASTRWRLARSTTPHEDRRRSGPAERWRSASCTSRRGARCLLHLGCGQPRWPSRRERWNGCSDTFPYSSLVGSTMDTCFRQSRGDTTGAVLGQGYDVSTLAPLRRLPGPR